jgi:hypothetical protein
MLSIHLKSLIPIYKIFSWFEVKWYFRRYENLWVHSYLDGTFIYGAKYKFRFLIHCLILSTKSMNIGILRIRTNSQYYIDVEFIVVCTMVVVSAFG